jgi:hypothetical protein
MNSDELKVKLAEQRARRTALVPRPVATKRRRPDFVTVFGLSATVIFSITMLFYLWVFERLPASPAEDVSAHLVAVSTNTSLPATLVPATPTPHTLRVCAGLPEARLHVRFRPGGEVRGYLIEGEVVHVSRQDEGWIEIESPIAGWVDARYLCE